MGFLLLGASLDTHEALRATYMYLLLYALMTGGFMLAYLHIRRDDGRPVEFLSDFCGLSRTESSVCWNLAIYLFSMAGVPPLAGFFSKYYILAAALSKGIFFLVVIALAVSLVSAYYYLRIIKAFWFEEPEAGKKLTVTLTPFHRALLSAIEAAL
jgi:NADH-quinone oxidoreductase subunit N